MQVVNDRKKELRSEMLAKRKLISAERRKAAEAAALEYLNGIVSDKDLILSYASFNDELETVCFNDRLASLKKLVLSYVSGQNLRFFRVDNCVKELSKSKWGILEPDPQQCEEIKYDQLSAVIVPGVAFSADGHRLGYGKGYYDRFLSLLPGHVATIGLGFREQLLDCLPIEPHDRTLSTLALL